MYELTIKAENPNAMQGELEALLRIFAPVQQQAPAPVQQQAPAPVQQQAPAPVQQQAPAPVQQQAPMTGVPVAAAPTYDHNQIMTAGAALIDAGKMAELMGLLGTFGVQAVTQLRPDQLGAFATELRKLGAQI